MHPLPGTRAVAFLFTLLISAAHALAHPSHGIVVNPRGEIFFVDERRNILWKVDGSGHLSALATNLHSHQLWLDPDGNLHGESLRFLPATQGWEGSLWRSNPNGVVEILHGPAPGFPPGLLMDATGARYEAHETPGDSPPRSLLRRRARDGTVTVLAGSIRGHADGPGRDARIDSVQAMFLARDGTLYFTETAAVRKLDAAGNVTTLARGLVNSPDPDLPTQKLWGLAVDAEGTVLVADYGGRRVLRLRRGAPPETILRSEKPWSPTGVAFDGQGWVVLEHGFRPPSTSPGPRVRRALPNGDITPVATVPD